MVTAEENKLLTEVGPGTPGGELLRRYWYPIAALAELDENPVRPVKLLGESLVLYRDRKGTLGLVDSACAHRRANLALGVPEEEGLRCPYHGWRFGETGQCLEQPAEKRPYCDKVKIKAYPVRVACGAVFAYLGPQPAPELPIWDLMAWDNVLHEIAYATLPCNWFQSMENAVDQDHLDWLHVAFSDYVLERNGRPDLKKRFWRPGEFKGEGDRGRLKEMLYERNDLGILRRAVYGDRGKDHPDWRLGIQVVFPNFARAVNDLQIRVPVDDTHFTYFLIRAHWLKPGEQAKQDKVPYFKIRCTRHSGHGGVGRARADLRSHQGAAGRVGQGHPAAASDVSRADRGGGEGRGPDERLPKARRRQVHLHPARGRGGQLGLPADPAAQPCPHRQQVEPGAQGTDRQVPRRQGRRDSQGPRSLGSRTPGGSPPAACPFTPDSRSRP